MDWPITFSLSTISTFLLFFTLLLTYLLAEAIYNVYFHPLASFPGPRVTALTNLYGMYYDMVLDGHGGLWSQKIYELHQEYGPIVRICPNEVHILDSSYYHNLYNFDPDLEKKPSHIFNLQHTATTKEHRRRRRYFDQYFSKSSIQRLEPLIKSTINKLTYQVSQSSGIVDLSFWYRCMTFEIICDFLLSQPYSLMDDPEKSSKMVSAFHSVFKILKPIQQISWVSWFMNNLERLPSWLQMAPWDEGMAYVKVWDEGLRPRLDRVRKGEVKSEDGRIVMMQEYLRDERVPEREKGYEYTRQAIMMFVGAGMETTGYGLGMASYQLLKRKDVLKELKKEIASVWPREEEEIPDWSILEKLPLLTAVLKESMRLSVGVASRLTRVNRKKAMRYKDWVIPAGCHVSINQSFVLYDEMIFPTPKKFEPARWMQGDKSKELDKYFVPFSRGSRGCIGERLAWTEMYLTLATVVHRFDMELYETEDVDVYPVYDHFVPFPQRDNGVRVTIKRQTTT